MDSLVSTEWLEAELGAPDLRVIDASFFLPRSAATPGPNMRRRIFPARSSSTSTRSPISDSPLPHMLPPEHKFASRMQSLGLGDGNRFVVYDNSPLHSAARAWWMLRSFGAHYVALLDGGLQKWKAEGRPLESGRAAAPPRPFHRRCSIDGAVVDKAAMLGLLGDGSHEIVDARAAGALRRRGGRAARRASPPAIFPARATCRRASFFNADNSWKRGDALRAAFDAAGVDLAKPMVTTCGSGVTAGGAAVRRASARQGGRAALRRQLVRMGRRSRRRPRRWARHERRTASPSTRLVEAGRREEWTQGHRQPAGLARLDHPVRQRRRRCEAANPPQDGMLHYGRNGTPTTWALVRGADRAGARRGDDPALSRRARPRSPAPCCRCSRPGDELLMVDSAYGPTRALLRRRAEALRRRPRAITTRWSAPASPR